MESYSLSGPFKATFWELHRQLGECYASDLAIAEGRQPDKKPSEAGTALQTLQFKFGEHLQTPVANERRLSNNSIISVDPHAARSERHIALDPTRSEKLSAKDRIEIVRGRRKQTMKTLGKVQGVDVKDDGSNTDINLKPHECWNANKLQKKPGGNRRLSQDCGATRDMLPLPTQPTKESLKTDGPRKYMFHPAGSFRTIWNMMTAITVLYDLIVIPLYAFDLPQTAALTVFGWTIMIFWNVDLVISFRTGFYDEGALVMTPLRVAVHYCRTWLLFDLALISLDWVLAFMDMSDSGEGQQWSRTLRMLRFLRLIRMLRWIKLRQANEALQDLLHSQVMSLYYGLASSIAHLMVLNHLIACAWFGVHHLSSDNWVAASNMEDSEIIHQYLVCLNWAFAQLGVGSSNAKPINSLEFAFCILIAFRSLITSSTLISTVSNLMAGLSKIKEDETNEFRLLRAYLAANDIQQQLTQKVTQFLQFQYALRQEARSADMQVPLLELLSQQLQGELQFARFQKALCKLRFIEDLIDDPDLQTMQVLHRLAMTALSNTIVAAKDVIFLCGSQAVAACLKLSGSLTYFHEDGTKTIDSSTWVAEVCLWTPWIFMGDLVADDVTRMALLDAASFGEILSQNWQTHYAAHRYAKDFLETLKKQDSWLDVMERDDASDGSFDDGSKTTAPVAKKKHCCAAFFGGRKRLAQVVATAPAVSTDSIH